jgi:hypothetical protein
MIAMEMEPALVMLHVLLFLVALVQVTGNVFVYFV